MIQDIYADGIGNVHVTGNMVRFDLVTLQPNLKSDNGQPVYNMNQRIILPLEAFIQGFLLQDNVMKKLIEAGIVNMQPAVANQPTVKEEAITVSQPIENE